MNARSIAFGAIAAWPTPRPARDRADVAAGPGGPAATAGVDGTGPVEWAQEDHVAQEASGAPEAEPDPWSRWARAVNLMAGGAYDTAWRCFTDLAALEIADRGECNNPDFAGCDDTDLAGCDNTEVAGLANAAHASGLRQLGEHAQAVDYDDRAISASGMAVLDGLIGRAADEIGLGSPDRCRHYLARADRLLSETSGEQSRSRIRIGWVTAEVSLLQGEPAVAPAQLAVEAAQALGSPRHLLKSRLIRAVAMREMGDPVGEVELVAVLRESDDLGIRTLVWPAALALGDGLPVDLKRPAAEAVAHIRNHLPRGDFDGWLATTDRLVTDP